MEVTISADMLIELAALLTALGVIGGVALTLLPTAGHWAGAFLSAVPSPVSADAG